MGKLTILGSDNGLSPGRRQAITWTNVRILLIGPLGTNFSEILIKIHTLSFMKIYLKISSAKWRLFCLGLSELTAHLCCPPMADHVNVNCCVGLGVINIVASGKYFEGDFTWIFIRFLTRDVHVCVKNQSHHNELVACHVVKSLHEDGEPVDFI